MSQFYVSADDSLGELRTAEDPAAAALAFAQERGLAAGTRLNVRWNVRFYPRDPTQFLSASVREVTVEGPPAAPPAAPAEAAPAEAAPAKAKRAPKAEAKAGDAPAPEAAPPAQVPGADT